MTAQPSSLSPVARARAAFPAWEALGVAERARRLAPIAARLAERMDAIVALVQAENGKPRVEAIGHEVVPSIAYARWVTSRAPEALAPERVRLTWLPHRTATVQRVPFGVVLVIAPWNVPLLIPLSQVLGALVAGNAVVLKPSEHTPRLGALVGELVEECDVPPGILQVVQGDGAVGQALVAARPDKVLFTGSVATGRKVMAAAAAHPIPVGLELGGVDALIVCDDADLELAASAAAWGATFNGGQACCSVERVLVQERVREPFLQLLADRLDAIDPRIELAPMVLDQQRAVWERHLEDARARGLDVRGSGWAKPRILAPTLVSGPGVEDALVFREETFGPVVAAASFADDDHAVRLHDGVGYGLTASVFSRSRSRARALAGRLRAGLVSINDVGATLYSQPELPWGGVGLSGFGRSHGREGLLDVTWARVVEEGRADVFEPKRPWWFPYDDRQAEMLAALGRAVAAPGPLAAARSLAAAGRAALHVVTDRPRR